MLLFVSPSLGFTAPTVGLRSPAIRMQAVEDAAVSAPAPAPAAPAPVAAPGEIPYPTAMLEALGAATVIKPTTSGKAYFPFASLAMRSSHAFRWLRC